MVVEPFERAEQLHAALWRCVPQVAAALVCADGSDSSHVRVSYLHRGPYEIGWSGQAYQWQPGPDGSKPLSADPEVAADEIGAALGVSRMSET